MLLYVGRSVLALRTILYSFPIYNSDIEDDDDDNTEQINDTIDFCVHEVNDMVETADYIMNRI